MITLDSGVVLDFPEAWKSFREGGRLVFHTPLREEILLSANRVAGSGSEVERAELVERLFANGMEAMKSAVAHPDLKVTKQLKIEKGNSALRCATILAESLAGDAFFGQAVFSYQQGVLLLTYEAPFVEGAEPLFREMLSKVRIG